MDLHKLWGVFLVGALFMTNGCAESSIGGKSVSDAFTALHVAAFINAVNAGDYAQADKLIQAGANVNAIGFRGVTPLIWIMGSTRSLLSMEYLLKAGADPNYSAPESEISAMFLAAGGDRSDILELVLKNKGNPNLLTFRGESMLMVAVGQLRDNNMKLLLQYGADMNYVDRHRETVADKAAGYGRYDLVVRFLEMGLKQDMQALAKTVEVVQVPAASEQQRWKEKAIEMLKERGAKFPAFNPKKAP